MHSCLCPWGTGGEKRKKQTSIYTYCLFVVAQLRNLGPSATKEIELQILWPSHDRRGNPVLEIDGKLQLNGTGSCNILLITPDNATVSV